MFIFRVSLSLSFINVILTTAYAHACRELTDRDSKDLSKAPSVSIRNDYGPTSPSYARDVRIQTHARRTPVENLTNRNTENNLLLRRVLSPEEVQHWIKFAQKATLEDRDGHLAFQRSYQENPRLLEPQVHHTAANHDANMATIRRWKIQLATKVAELQRHGRLKEATEYKTAMLQYIETKEKSQLGIASMSKGAIHKALSLIEGGSTHKGSNKESSSSGRSGSTRIRRSGVEDLEKIDEERKHREIQRRGNMLSMKLDNLSPEEIGSWIRVAKDAAQKSQNDQKCMERYYGQPRERRPKGFVAKSQADHLLEMATIFPKGDPLLEIQKEPSFQRKLRAILKYIRDQGRGKEAHDLEAALNDFNRAEEACYKTAHTYVRQRGREEKGMSRGSDPGSRRRPKKAESESQTTSKDTSTGLQGSMESSEASSGEQSKAPVESVSKSKTSGAKGSGMKRGFLNR